MLKRVTTDGDTTAGSGHAVRQARQQTLFSRIILKQLAVNAMFAASPRRFKTTVTAGTLRPAIPYMSMARRRSAPSPECATRRLDAMPPVPGNGLSQGCAELLIKLRCRQCEQPIPTLFSLGNRSFNHRQLLGPSISSGLLLLYPSGIGLSILMLSRC